MSTRRSTASRLVFERDGRSVEFELSGEVCTIGRGPANDLALDRPTISRRHARLVLAPDTGWRIEDRGSLKGTRIDGTPDLARPLRDGDVIRLGRFPITFRSGAASVERGAGLGTDDGSVIFAADELARSSGPTVETSPPELDAAHTVVRRTVDFSALAAADDAPAVPARLERALAVVAGASRALLGAAGDGSEGDGPDDADAPARHEARVFRRVLALVFDHLPAERGCIMRWDAASRTLRPVCERTRPGVKVAATSRLPFSRTIAATVMRDRVAVATTDALADERFADGASVLELGIRSAICAPLWHGDRVEGLISIDTSSRTGAFDRFDLDLLSAVGNHLALAIEQSRMHAAILDQQLVRRRLERYHSPAVVERIVGRASDDAGLAEEKDVTVLFADLVGFTAVCERMEPREIALWLNDCFESMTEAVFRHEGMLDKFVGDGLMAVFGAPIAQPDHAARALRAASEMRRALAARPAPLADTTVRCRIGLHSGRVVAGDLGSRRRSDYTVLGRTVNTAARVESAVAGPDRIVLTEATRLAAGPGFDTRPIGEHALKGIERAVVCHELYDGEASGRA